MKTMKINAVLMIGKFWCCSVLISWFNVHESMRNCFDFENVYSWWISLSQLFFRWKHTMKVRIVFVQNFVSNKANISSFCLWVHKLSQSIKDILLQRYFRSKRNNLKRAWKKLIKWKCWNNKWRMWKVKTLSLVPCSGTP